MFFLSLTMGPIIFNHDKFPPFLTMPVLVAPFLIMFFCLFVALLPRYPQPRAVELLHLRQGDARRFLLSRPQPKRGAGAAAARRDPLRHSLLEDAVPAHRVLHLHRLRPGVRAAAGDLRAMIEELDGHVPLRLNSTPKDAATHYRNVIGAFTETIRLSDFKANVAIVFAGIMMGPVVAFRDKLPHFVPLDVALAPFLLVFLCLLICLYPRYGSEGRVISSSPATPRRTCSRGRTRRRSSSRSCRRCARSCRASSIGRR